MPPITMPLAFQPRDGHQQRFTCGSQHRPPSNDGTYTLFIPSSEVVPERLALLLAARCDSSACGEQYRTVEDELGLIWTPLDDKIRLRRVTDSYLLLVGSLGAGNPTDAYFIPLATLSRKVYIFFEAACFASRSLSLP